MKVEEITVRLKFSNDAKELYSGSGPLAATAGSAGFDLRAAGFGASPEASAHIIQPGERSAIHTGISVEPTRGGVAGFVYSRSGLGAVQGLTVAQGVGLIDPDYRGEILVYLLNTGSEPRTVKRGDRIAQLVFQPYFRPSFEVVEELGETKRGGGGFGHTGA